MVDDDYLIRFNNVQLTTHTAIRDKHLKSLPGIESVCLFSQFIGSARNMEKTEGKANVSVILY